MNVKQSFLNEVEELLNSINDHILMLEEQPEDEENVNHIFRAAHTLKGSANLYGYSGIATLTHLLEGILDELRSGSRSLEPTLTDILLECFDQIRMMAGYIEAGAEDPQSEPELLHRLSQYRTRPGSVTVSGTGSSSAHAAMDKLEPRPALFSSEPKEWVETVKAFMAGEKEKDTFAHLFPLYTSLDGAGVQPERGQVRQLRALAMEAEALAECRIMEEKIVGRLSAMIDKLIRMAEKKRDQEQLLMVYMQFLVTITILEQYCAREEDGPAVALPSWWADVLQAVQGALLEWARGGSPVAISDMVLDLWELCKPEDAAKQEFGTLLMPEVEEWSDGMEAHDASTAQPGARAQRSAFAAEPEIAAGVAWRAADEGIDEAAGRAVVEAADRYAGASVPEAAVYEAPIDMKVMVGLAKQLIVEQIHFLAPKGRPLIERWELAKELLLQCAMVLGDETLHALTQAAAPDIYALKELAGGYSEASVEVATEAGGGAEPAIVQEKRTEPGQEVKPEASNVQPSRALAKVGVHPAERSPVPIKSVRSETAAETEKIIRVETGKVERVMDLIGELAIAKNAFPFMIRSMVEDPAAAVYARELKERFAMLDRITKELQDAIVDIRMLPVAHVFSKFNRFVRDMARQSGKQIRLEFRGEETTLDKTLVEALSDPLIHLIRNAIDHGIEAPEERTARGKPAEGLLCIEACREGNRVVLEVSDDGAGIDVERIRAKLRESGLVEGERLEKLEPHELIPYIFRTGFSTAEEVTSLSGRGIGMDAVRTTIVRLQGDVQVFSEAGQGTKVRIELPLTLSMTQVLQVSVGGDPYGIPLDQIEETGRVTDADLQTMQGQPILMLRDKVYPVICLRKYFGLENRQDEGKQYLVILKTGFALKVDSLIGQQEVVVKPPQDGFKHLPYLAGASILGDGTVLLIINGNAIYLESAEQGLPGFGMGI
ncbi:chemotaxis protein CheA [Paenibacillus turpanensis]|uniref:chemotaxis protein CheA n=1 Tax=Paenibacillus turpanensis TaxID=2689078 RepID=UPI00140B006F|nr:chemotaxis protein CheA [Paenibacillus turpanensis]